MPDDVRWPVSLADYRSDYCTHEVHGEVVLVRITPSRLGEEQNLDEFGEQLFAYMDKYECRRIGLNCGAITYASSPAMGKLITLHRRLNREGGRLVLFDLLPSMSEIVAAARLNTYFEIVETADEAIRILSTESDEA